MASKRRGRAGVTEADVQKQARSQGLELDVHGQHDWAHISVFLDMEDVQTAIERIIEERRAAREERA